MAVLTSRGPARDNPRLEEYLDEVPESAQTALLRGLLAVEIEYRRDAEGNRVSDDLILAAHPELSEAVAEALEKLHEPDATASHTPDAADAPASDSIPGYTILKELNRGGQGVVYQAIQKSTRRKVALKVMLEGPFAGPDSRHRFEREVALVGSLRHPNIVPVFDSGVAQGQFFYAMEYVRGKSLKRYVQGEQLSLEQTLRLFKKVCDAVNCAHQRGVIHRDLKPTNILVDNTGEPHVLDFGLAKVGGAEVDGDSRSMLVSVTGQVIGTLPYMCPEQAAGRPDEIDMRSDVYALGVILYELLTGTFPYDVKAQMADVLANILKAEPRRPSTIGRQINDEVETIILKTLSKEKERRYDTAGALGRDIDHYLAGESIDAKRDSALYVLRKTLRRYKVHAGVAAGFVVLVTTAAIAMSVMYRQQRLLSEQLDVSLKTALANEHAARKAESEANDAREAASESEREARHLLYIADMNVAIQAWHENNVGRVQDLLSRHRPKPGQGDLRGFEWHYMSRLCERSRNTPRIELSDFGGTVAFFPDGRTLAVSLLTGTIALYDVSDLQTPRMRDYIRLWSGQMIWESFAKFSPDGSALAYGDEDRAVIRLRFGLEREIPLRGHGGNVINVAFSLKDELIASSSEDETIKIWSQITGEQVQDLDVGSTAVTLAFSPNGRWLAAGCLDGTMKVWSAVRWQPVWSDKVHTKQINSVSFSHDSSILASGSEDGSAKLWDVGESGLKLIVPLNEHQDAVRSVAFAPDDELVATGSRDNTIKLWKLSDHSVCETLKGHSGIVGSIAFSPDGKTLASASQDYAVRLWDVASRGPADFIGCQKGIGGVCLAEEEGLVIADAGDDIQAWHLKSGEARALPDGFSRVVVARGVSCEGILALADNNEIHFWQPDDLKHREVLPRAGFRDRPSSAAVSFVHNMLAVGCETGRIEVWDLRSRNRKLLPGHSAAVSSVAVVNGNLVASGDSDGAVKVWDVKSGRVVAEHHQHRGRVNSLSSSPDGRMLASGSMDNDIYVWRLSESSPSKLKGHSASVHSLLFSSDGRTLVSAGGDRVIRIWDIDFLQQKAVLAGHQHRVTSLAWSSDEGLLVSGSTDQTIRFWRAAPAAKDESDE